MTIVTTLAELQDAIAAQEPDIQASASFIIDETLQISYGTTISSAAGGPYTLTKADSFDAPIFALGASGALTLRNIILDGAKDTHTGTANNALIEIPFGSLNLETGSVLQNNSVPGSGGAIYAKTSDTLPLKITMRGDATIRGNRAGVNGGGIYLYFDAQANTLALYDQARIEDNEAGNQGGGIFYQATGSNPDPFTFGDNVKITGNRAEGGAGIWAGRVALTIAGSAEVSGNQARVAGGGLAWTGDQLRISGTIQTNQAGVNGGGLYLVEHSGASIAISGIVADNTAGTGGGIYLDTSPNGMLDLTNAQILRNHAGDAGGGCYIIGGGLNAGNQTINLAHTSFLANRADGSGGGLALGFSGESMRYDLYGLNSQFRENTAGGNGGGISAQSSADSWLELSNSVIADNSADSGGGVYAVSASGYGSLYLNIDTFTGNTATQNGGAVAVADDGFSFLLSHSTMDGNRALQGNGGGLYCTGDSGRFTVGGLNEFTANQAANGGGIYHSGVSQLEIDLASFSQNAATQSGRDIYNGGPMSLSQDLAVQDGLYLLAEASVPEIAGPLDEAAVVQLEESAYVTPNPTGSPIVVAEASTAYPSLSQTDADAFRAPETAGFAGWGPRLNGDGNQVVLAPIAYTLHYQNTKGVYNPNPSQYNVLTPAISLQPLSNPAGYRFIGWFDAPAGGTQVTEIPLGSTGDKTLYAQWQKTEYTLTYYGNDAGGPTAQNIPSPVMVPDGQSVTLSDTTPTRAGFAFTGWNTEPTGTGTAYQAGDTIPDVRADLALYAQWIPQPPACYTLTYCGNDAGGPPACCVPRSQPIPAGAWVRISCCAPHREGYRFTGWNTEPSGTGQVVCPGQPFGPATGDVCLYAQWRCLPPPKPLCIPCGE